MEDKGRKWTEYSDEEKLLVIDGYLDGVVALDDENEEANRQRLEWIRAHVPAYKVSDGKNYIFVSYSHLDYKEVYKDLAAFSYNSQRRVRFWYDEGLPIGQDWEKAAGELIKNPRCVGVLFYLSKNLLLSPSVFKEIECVKALGKPYFTIALDGNSYSVSKIFAEADERELSGVNRAELEKFFPDNNTALISYGNQNLWARIEKIAEAFDVTEEVFSDFVCEEVEGGMRLVEYAGNKTEVFIPSYIDGKPLLEIFCDFTHAIKIHIPETVVKIHGKPSGIFPLSEYLEEIKVDDGNAVYFDVNGVLCDKRQNCVLRAPIGWRWRNQFVRFASHKTNENLSLAVSRHPGANVFGHSFDTEQVLIGFDKYEVDISDAADLYRTLRFDNLSAHEYLQILDSPEKRFEIYREIKEKSVFNGIDYIGAGAFAQCRNIDYLFLPDNIKIRPWAFRDSNLRLIFLPENLEAIGENLFSGCHKLATVLTDTEWSINPGVKGLKGKALLGARISFIGSFAFKNTAVEEVTLNAGLTELGDSVFIGCGKIKRIVVPGAVEHITEETFADCTLLREVVLKRGVRGIGEYAFINCVSLRKLTIPQTVKAIDSSAFWACDSIETIEYEGTQAEWEEIKFFTLGKKVKFNFNIFKSSGSDQPRKFTLSCKDGEIIEFI